MANTPMMSPIAVKLSPRAQMQVGADVGKDALEQRALEADRQQHDARPGIAQHDLVACDRALPGRDVARLARDGIGRKLGAERHGCEREHRRQQEEHRAPAEIVADDASRRLAEHLAQHLSGEESAEHLLAMLVGDHVADVGEADRQDPRDGDAGGEARECQAVQ